MWLTPGFLLRIAKGGKQADEGPGKMSIIISQRYAHLEEELGKTFKGQKDVKVIVDRRYGERRASLKPVVKGQRHVDRRSTNEQLVEVVISA
jgi:hypothetical protein